MYWVLVFCSIEVGFWCVIFVVSLSPVLWCYGSYIYSLTYLMSVCCD